jgi:hypothetical protein
MAFSDLASNQAVSFTNAQSSGAPLKPGQSHTTSDEIMTKSDLTTKYNVLTSNSTLSPKSSNQTVAKRDFTNVLYCNAATFTHTGWQQGGTASCGQTEYWVDLGNNSGNVVITLSSFSSFPSNGLAFRVDYGATNLLNTTIYSSTGSVTFSYTYSSGTAVKITVGSACP